MRSIFVNTSRLAAAAALLMSTASFFPPDLSAAGNAAVTTTTAHLFPDGPTKEGASSTLVRNNAGATTTFLSPTLTVGDVYTLWWVVFNHPENCSGGICNLDDVLPFPGNTAAGVSLIYGAGHVIPTSGRGNFAAHLAVGDTTGAMFGPGLVNPLGAVIHVALRTHGPVIPAMLDEQLSSFAGGCSVNACANEIIAEHNPLTDQNSVDLEAVKSLLERLAQRQGLRP
jgi:hypothetical protein